MARTRLDQALVDRRLVTTRSQAESYIKLGKVTVGGKVVLKASQMVTSDDKLAVSQAVQYVSRAALKLESVAKALKLDFRDKTVLDVGSSTGGFTDFALRDGAEKVIAVDVGKAQLHSSLRGNKRIELHEQTDIREVSLTEAPDLVLIDVSFVSLRDILPSVAKLSGPATQIVAMVKPQFEAGVEDVHKGVIKNDALRRQILKNFETWAKQSFVIRDKADSQVAGTKGNLERFYLLSVTR